MKIECIKLRYTTLIEGKNCSPNFIQLGMSADHRKFVRFTKCIENRCRLGIRPTRLILEIESHFRFSIESLHVCKIEVFCG